MGVEIQRMKFIRQVFTSAAIPEWVKPTKEFLQLLKEDSEEILPWFFCDEKAIYSANLALKNNYRNRELFVFAHRDDSDLIAFFEKSKPGKVVLVYNFDDPGYEAGPEFVSFEAWYEYAIKVENGDHFFDNIPGIDFDPHRDSQE